MLSFIISTVIFILLTVVPSEVIEGSLPTLQKTIQALYLERSDVTYPGVCKWLRPSPRQTKMCRRDPGLVDVLETARNQALDSCEEAFKYDRWNCSNVFNNKSKRSIFNKIFRETAFIYALISASLTHAVAKGCASGHLARCSCFNGFGRNASKNWKNAGCGDDFKHGKRVVKNFLDFKHAGTDQIAEALKQNVLVGIDSVGEQLREVCKCHGFSGSCTTKTCWKRLGPFHSAMGLLKKQYHHAVKKKIVNYTAKRAIAPEIRKRINVDRKSLLYLQKTPNLCLGTVGRGCRDKENCATLCCGRGYHVSVAPVETRCKCRMISCCFVKCDTCEQDVEFYTCK